jgi:hypothetical protein
MHFQENHEMVGSGAVGEKKVGADEEQQWLENSRLIMEIESGSAQKQSHLRGEVPQEKQKKGQSRVTHHKISASKAVN